MCLMSLVSWLSLTLPASGQEFQHLLKALKLN
jgi:hypothetical protein